MSVGDDTITSTSNVCFLYNTIIEVIQLMKLTPSVMAYLNTQVSTIDSSTPCLVISVDKENDKECKINYSLREQFPKEFDIDWFSLREPSWKFFVVFKEEKLFGATLNYGMGEQLIMDIPQEDMKVCKNPSYLFVPLS